MANIVVRALKAFTVRNASTGELTSVACGTFASIDESVGESLIASGLAANATKAITSNGVADVTGYEKVNVAVG